MSLVSREQMKIEVSNLLEKEFSEAYMSLLRPRRIVDMDSHYVYMRRFMNIGEFHIRVGENFVRVFTLQTMPMKLKEVLAMIHAIDWPCKDNEQIPMSRPDYVPEHFLDTGWMTSPHEYVVCLPNSFLDELTGKSLV